MSVTIFEQISLFVDAALLYHHTVPYWGAFSQSGCKGSAFFWNGQPFAYFFLFFRIVAYYVGRDGDLVEFRFCLVVLHQEVELELSVTTSFG